MKPLPQTPRYKQVIKLAETLATKNGNAYVGIEHLAAAYLKIADPNAFDGSFRALIEKHQWQKQQCRRDA
jgi:hypothetical protein